MNTVSYEARIRFTGPESYLSNLRRLVDQLELALVDSDNFDYDGLKGIIVVKVNELKAYKCQQCQIRTFERDGLMQCWIDNHDIEEG